MSYIKVQLTSSSNTGAMPSIGISAAAAIFGICTSTSVSEDDCSLSAS